MNIKDKIQSKIEKTKYFQPRRCWYMAFKLYKSLPKQIREQLSLVEGDTHYWLEDTEGNIYDIYAQLGGFDYYDLEEIARYDPELLSFDENTYDEQFAENVETGRERLVRVHYLQGLDEARI